MYQVRSLFVPPGGASSSRSLSLSPDQRFPKSSKFTDSIVVHGRWENNTLDEATNLLQRERRLKERTMQKMDQMSNKFRGEVEKVHRIKKVVRTRQLRLAQANLRACCAIIIQTNWRGYHSRVLAQERRAALLGAMVLRWWRRFKAQRSMSIVRRFVTTAMRQRADTKMKILGSAIMLQGAWRRRMVRESVARLVLASSAIEAVVVNYLGELTERLFIESLIVKIQRVWKRRRLRQGNRHRKDLRLNTRPEPQQPPRTRAFVTQGNEAVTPRRKPRFPTVRAGLPSDPSSTSSRSGPSTANRGKGRNPSAVPAIPVLAVIAAAADERDRGQREQSNVSTPSRLSFDKGSGGEPSPAGSYGGARPEVAKRPPIATVKRCDSPRSCCSSGGLEELSGDCGDASEDVGKSALPTAEDPTSEVAVDRETRQPCRPSYERPSKLVAEGRKHAFTAGASGQGEVGGKDGNFIGEEGSSPADDSGVRVAQPGAAAAAAIAVPVSKAEGRPSRDNGSSRGSFRDTRPSQTSLRVETGLVSETKQAEGYAGELESKDPPAKSPVMEEYADEAFESDGEISRSR